MTSTTFMVLLASSVFAAVGQVLLKLGAPNIAVPASFLNASLVLGLAAYVIGLLLWLAVLSRLPLHVVYTFTMCTFVLVGIASVFVLGERPSMNTLLGWSVIAVGLLMVSLGS